MNIIINADDCGYNHIIDRHIALAIQNRSISSTTIMANMEDLAGAKKLFEQYHNNISFGLHINLTEGTPLLPNQLLLDKGFYIEQDNIVTFNSNPFRRKLLCAEMRSAIHKEVLAQAEKVMSFGIKLSHIDGHHFIHQAVFMIPVLPQICREIGVNKVRNYSNYLPLSINRTVRNLWLKFLKLQNRDIISTDFFTSYDNFYNMWKCGIVHCSNDNTIELMCHPGGIYPDEEKKLMTTSCEKTYNCKLINYNTL